MPHIHLPHPKQMFELTKEWNPLLQKDPKNAYILKDYFTLALNSYKTSDLEKWRAVPNTRIPFLPGTRLSVDRYVFIHSGQKLSSYVNLKIREISTNQWLRGQRPFRVVWDDFKTIECELL